MKPLFFFLFLSLNFIFFESKAQAFGEANWFYHDANGNRIYRQFTVDAAFKMGNTASDSMSVDTAVIKKDIQANENEQKNEQIIIKAYPNPVNNFLIVENLSWKDDYKVTVLLYDEAGQFISKKNITQAKDIILFNGFAPGTYQVHYYIRNTLLTVWKIIKL
jgi:hypothetical protein